MGTKHVHLWQHPQGNTHAASNGGKFRVVNHGHKREHIIEPWDCIVLSPIPSLRDSRALDDKQLGAFLCVVVERILLGSCRMHAIASLTCSKRAAASYFVLPRPPFLFPSFPFLLPYFLPPEWNHSGSVALSPVPFVSKAFRFTDGFVR